MKTIKKTDVLFDENNGYYVKVLGNGAGSDTYICDQCDETFDLETFEDLPENEWKWERVVLTKSELKKIVGDNFELESEEK